MCIIYLHFQESVAVPTNKYVHSVRTHMIKSYLHWVLGPCVYYDHTYIMDQILVRSTRSKDTDRPTDTQIDRQTDR